MYTIKAEQRKPHKVQQAHKQTARRARRPPPGAKGSSIRNFLISDQQGAAGTRVAGAKPSQQQRPQSRSRSFTADGALTASRALSLPTPRMHTTSRRARATGCSQLEQSRRLSSLRVPRGRSIGGTACIMVRQQTQHDQRQSEETASR